MSCQHCRDLCVEYEIRWPEHLDKALRIITRSVNDGILSEIKSFYEDKELSFSEYTEGRKGTDYVDFLFKCNYCGTRFSLYAETYHGRGGYWCPIGSGIKVIALINKVFSYSKIAEILKEEDNWSVSESAVRRWHLNSIPFHNLADHTE